MNALISANVPDPTDFPPLHLAPGLRTLDGSVRCNICGELYDAPVTLSCGHCFCSFCIRTSLSEKQECPTCRKSAMDGHLRPNPVIEEVVSAWKISRSYILRLSKEDDEQRNSNSTPKRVFRDVPSAGSSAVNQGSPSKYKRKRQASEDLLDATIPTSEADEDERLEDRPVKMVDCPLCNKRVRFGFINQHMDTGCRGEGPSSNRAMAGWKKLMAPVGNGKQKEINDDEDNHRLPKVSYATLKDKQLREILVEQGLSTTGDRNQCIHRHHRWVIMFNANLDRSSNTRKSKPDLRKELKRWEEEKTKRRKTVVEDTVAHEKRHSDEFKQLIDAARASSSAQKIGVAANRKTGACSPNRLQEIKQRGGEDVIVVDSEGEQEMG